MALLAIHAVMIWAVNQIFNSWVKGSLDFLPKQNKNLVVPVAYAPSLGKLKAQKFLYLWPHHLIFLQVSSMKQSKA
jgi:hypothetical protein